MISAYNTLCDVSWSLGLLHFCDSVISVIELIKYLLYKVKITWEPKYILHSYPTSFCYRTQNGLLGGSHTGIGQTKLCLVLAWCLLNMPSYKLSRQTTEILICNSDHSRIDDWSFLWKVLRNFSWSRTRQWHSTYCFQKQFN